jgi:hypothetical protein
MKNIIKITFEDLEKGCFPSVTDYCRKIVDDGAAVDNYIIEVYRGEMLCLTVNDIRKAATIMPSNGKWIKYDKTKRKGSREPRTEV